MRKYSDIVLSQEGGIIAGATVTVNVAGGGLASIFGDNVGTPKANPFTNESDGSFKFYATNGRYDIVLFKSGFAFDNTDTTDVLLFDSLVPGTTYVAPIFSGTITGTYTLGGTPKVLATGSTTPRSLTERFAEVFTVEDYYDGAIPGDYTAAIVAAIAAAAPVGGIVVGYKTYGISSTITTPVGDANAFLSVQLAEVQVLPSWSSGVTAPAFHFRTRHGRQYIGHLDCGKIAAGMLFEASNQELLTGCVIEHFQTYGIKTVAATTGNSTFYGFTVRQWNQDDAEFDNYAVNWTAVGIDIAGNDAQWIGGFTAWSLIPLRFQSTAAGNQFHGVHVNQGFEEGQGHPVLTNPTIIENYSAIHNLMHDCYYDNGRVHMYEHNLQLHGGFFVNNPTIITLDHPWVRYYANNETKPTQFKIKNLKVTVGFLTRVGFSDFLGNYSVINAETRAFIPAGAAYAHQIEHVIIPRDTNSSPARLVQSPGSPIEEEFDVGTVKASHIVSSTGEYQIKTVNQPLRVTSYAADLPCKFILGEGTAGLQVLAANVLSIFSGTVNSWDFGDGTDKQLKPLVDNTYGIGNASQRIKYGYIGVLRPGGGTVEWTSGAGSPEGVVAAAVGSLYTRTDGGAGTTLYAKESGGSGSTGWVGK